MALTKLSTDNIDLSGNTTALTIPSGVSVNTTDTTGTCNYPTTATALYQLDGNANDTCGNYNGTASNMTWTTGKFGECGVFNGTNGASGSRILLSNDVDQYPMSVSCWIYLDAVQASSNGAIVFEGQQGMGINFTGGNPTYLSTQSQNSQTGQVDSNSTLNTGQWYFVVGIFNSSSSSELYIDNVAQSGSSSIDYLTSDENAIGGRDHYGYTATFNGKIDQLRIFPSALTTAQMTELYNETNVTNTTGRPSSPTEGLLRDNTTTGALEFYDGSLWQQIAGTLVPDNAPSSNFNTVLYTGDSSTQAITVGFKPDWVIVKSRTQGYEPTVFDTVRGALERIRTSSSTSEDTKVGSLTSFDTNGFTTGNYAGMNNSGQSFVAWCWKAGGAPTATNVASAGASPTSGSVMIDGVASTSSLAGSIAAKKISANTKTGFSIVKYEGNSTDGATVAHGLTAIPELVIIKRTDSTANWIVGSSYLSGWNKILQLDLSDPEATYSGFYNTSPTNTVFYLGTQGAVNTNDYIAYCFHSVESYSKIGSYTGNGNATGPIVQTGFEPAWLMVKNISTTKYWYIVDNKRSTTNPRNKELYFNVDDTEATMNSVNFVNNGFEIVTTDSGYNTLNNEYIYLAISS